MTVLFRRRGSIIPRSCPVAFASAFLVVILMVLEKYEIVPATWMPILHHPIGVQMYAITFGYVTVLRASVACGRYFEGVTNCQFFASKWVDAYTQLCGFVRSSVTMHRKKEKENPDKCHKSLQELYTLQNNLLMWFALLHAMAINSLQVTQLDLDEDNFMDRLHWVEAPEMDHLKGPAVASEVKAPPAATTQGGKRPSAFSNLPVHVVTARKASVASVKSEGCNVASRVSTSSEVDGARVEGGLSYLKVVGQLSEEHRKTLLRTEAKVDLVHSWIIEGVALAALKGYILTQPPILSRVYQELSNGMLGYNQAYKIALVQFPFAFAQMLTLFLVVFLMCCPLVVFVFTGGEVLSPGLTFITVIGFWGIHEIAVEIENPFGVDSNHLPLATLHETMVNALLEVSCVKAPPAPPPDEW